MTPFNETFNGKKPIKTKVWLEVKKAIKKHCRKCTSYRCYPANHIFFKGHCVWCPITKQEYFENRQLVQEVLGLLEGRI